MSTCVPFKAIAFRAWPAPRVIIPRVAQDELHEMCILKTWSTQPRNGIIIFIVLPRVFTRVNEVINCNVCIVTYIRMYVCMYKYMYMYMIKN